MNYTQRAAWRNIKYRYSAQELTKTMQLIFCYMNKSLYSITEKLDMPHNVGLFMNGAVLAGCSSRRYIDSYRPGLSGNWTKVDRNESMLQLFA